MTFSVRFIWNLIQKQGATCWLRSYDQDLLLQICPFCSLGLVVFWSIEVLQRLPTCRERMTSWNGTISVHIPWVLFELGLFIDGEKWPKNENPRRQWTKLEIHTNLEGSMECNRMGRHRNHVDSSSCFGVFDARRHADSKNARSTELGETIVRY